MTFCLWITGLPGSGKSTIARELEAGARAAHIDIMTLNLDRIRKVLTPDPKYTDDERAWVYRSLVLLAKLMVEECGKNVMIDATGNRRKYRDVAREHIPEFAEVYVYCPEAICRSREAARTSRSVEKNLYEKAEKGRLSGALPGVTAPYEPPDNPEVWLPSHQLTPQESARTIMDYIESRWCVNTMFHGK